jgi:hypothetical protein
MEIEGFVLILAWFSKKKSKKSAKPLHFSGYLIGSIKFLLGSCWAVRRLKED